ncbi:MAG: M48 family metallopeptidase [Deferrisomatales bacterium]
MTERLEVGGLTFEVRRSPRRKTLGLTVDRGGELVLHAPAGAPEADLVAWARSKLLWVHRKLALKEEVAPRVREPEFVTGETFRYLGRAYRLAVVAEQPEPLCCDGRRFFLRRDARARGAELFQQWYVRVGTPWVAQRAELLAHRAGGEPSRVEVRDLGYRWGSCGVGGVLYFNWRLLQLPVRLVDYVIAHELVHLAEPHHSPGFWAALERSLPDWRVREAELRGAARDAYWCHGEMAQ